MVLSKEVIKALESGKAPEILPDRPSGTLHGIWRQLAQF
jgi:hypothetical protein